MLEKLVGNVGWKFGWKCWVKIWLEMLGGNLAGKNVG